MNSIDTSFSPAPQGDDIDFARRFGGIGRLYGERALERFKTAHVCVIGVGGVGSWIVEALRDRIAQINPFCKVNLVEDFVEVDNIVQMIGGNASGSPRYDYVVDAIDSVKAKAALIAHCRDHAIPLLTSGGAGGQLDPTKIEVRDLARTEQEPLLKKVRKVLRAQYGFSRGEKQKYHIDAVFSMEPLRYPELEDACEIESSITGLNCAGFGSSMVVTASFGMIAAAHILRKLAEAANAAAAPAAQPEFAGA